MAKEIVINKMVEFKKYESYLKLTYRGRVDTIKEDDKEKAEELIDAVLGKKKKDIFQNLRRNIELIRIILRESPEEYLTINYEDDQCSEKVQYSGRKLRSYKLYKEGKAGGWIVRVNWSEDRELEITIYDKYLQFDNKKMLNWVMDRIYSMEKNFFLWDSEELIKIYEVFYNEYPDFNEENINIKIQIMLKILAQFNISFDFTKKLSTILGFLTKASKLLPIEELVEYMRNQSVLCNIDKEATIKAIGEIVRETMNNENAKELESNVQLIRTIKAKLQDV